SLGDAIDHSRDPELLNDLGAALSTRYSVTHSTDDLRNAVRALDRAWTMSPSAETAWNRAVTAELAEPSRAARLWADYVALDSTSRWGREAMLRMRRVGS
ncbi:MAG: hypothetical protein QOK07_298, partial [Gemmatimonadaceae bacterium]|nr:hypothetical protein [Gemmatimonadaceae bacterium]